MPNFPQKRPEIPGKALALSGAFLYNKDKPREANLALQRNAKQSKGAINLKILVINAGSSSLKYQFLDMKDEKVLAKGNCERIGEEAAGFHYKTADNCRVDLTMPLKTHIEALNQVVKTLMDPEVGAVKSMKEIDAIGHRVAQGGPTFSKSVHITPEVEKQIEDLIPLAPLHNGPELEGIRACKKVFGDKVPQVAVFDTSFHATMPPKAYLYAIPYRYYEKYKIRRYGFHGTSHRYVSHKCAELMGRPLDTLKMITCHIGNGSSIAAIRHGKVIDTSMGLTPLDGFMMGTRCGSLDPSIVTYLMEKENLSPEEMNRILNEESGMLGVSGLSSDDRDIAKGEIEGNPRAILTHEMLVYQIVKFIGAYVAALGGLDCLVFTAGIGENQVDLRRNICRGLFYLGIEVDDAANHQMVGGKAGEISTERSRIPVWVVPTNEELLIARDTQDIVTRLRYALTEDKTVVDPLDV